MKISTEISSAAAIVGAERAVEYCANAGFNCACINPDWI